VRDPLPNWVPLDAGPASPCPYLPDRLARFSIGACVPSAADLDRLLALGHRRSGRIFYRPGCPGGCLDCTPLRVPVAQFRPTRSQRRVAARGARAFRVAIRPAGFDEETYEVYRRHHARISPGEEPAGVDDYRWSFVESCVDTRFVEYRVDGRLAAVSVLDIGRRAASSVYVSWDPAFAALGPGTYSALWEIDRARREGLDFYYLGYWIGACPQLAYKDRFGPHQVYDWGRQSWGPGRSGAALDPGSPDHVGGAGNDDECEADPRARAEPAGGGERDHPD
jgi:arginine-tRNA-protein transferase